MKKLLVALMAIGLFLNVTAQKKNFWKQHNTSEIINTHKSVSRTSFPKNFKLFDVDDISFFNELLSITGKKSNKRSIVISLPNAAGGIEDFELVESSNFEPALQERFPQIRAYSGRSISKPGSTIKLSISPQGIQTMVFRSDDENEFIEQYSNDKKVYAVFRSQRKPGAIPWNCSTTEKQMVTSLNNQATALSLTTARSGGNLKTLRLAQSCNAEYSNYFGATKAADSSIVLAAFNATLTRCNGVYEKDLAIHLNLIANTTKIIYYTASSDPYSSTMSNWNSQLQNTLTSVIGEANYDIGHMFGASGGGGNAGCIGCICVNGSKGSGITSPGDGVPQGDNFDIDYVVHEIGHQLGANHTFSMSNEGSGVNKEVGSGITIMGYAGITSQDVAPHSIDIFHQASIAQIQTNVNNKSTCGITISNSSIATPVVTVPKSAYTIPKSTPFALTASATDANANDVLTYCWEQNDNAGSTQTGASSVASATKATGPNWISYSPSTSPTRLFPKLSTILVGSTVSGPLPGGDAVASTEALSSVARTLNFRLTVRDNAPYKNSADTGYSIGQTSFADVLVTVNGTAGPFAVTAPNTAVSWRAGSTQTITWSVNSTNLSPVNCSKVKISLSTDGGNTFPIVLSDSTANDGSEAFVIPNSESSTARIKIEAVRNVFFDISNINFTIRQPALCGDVTNLNTTLITNNSARISWRKVTAALSYTVEYKLNTDTGWTTFNIAQTDTTAALTGLLPNTAYNWKVRSTCNEGAGEYFQSNFTTLANCGTPAGLSTSSIGGNNATINWNAVTNAINYRVEYKLNSASDWILVNDTSTKRSVILTNLQTSTSYNWRVSARCSAGLGNATSANFTTICQSRYDSSANGTLAGATLIPFNTNITGLINVKGDIDNFKLVFTQADSINIMLTNLVVNYNLKLLNSTGQQVAISQRNSTSNESISIRVSPGIYYAQVYAGSTSIFNATNCYTLKATLLPTSKKLAEITNSKNNLSSTTAELNPIKSVILYPNPVKDKLNIKLTGIEGASEFIIYNMNGEKIMSAKSNKANSDLDLTSLKPGYYTIKVINQNKIESSLKILKL
jgi:hypothetical protein